MPGSIFRARLSVSIGSLDLGLAEAVSGRLLWFGLATSTMLVNAFVVGATTSKILLLLQALRPLSC